ncbi:VirB4-like conjugal transfer ATPase, CD1110 family [Patescibacteria group bacterium]
MNDPLSINKQEALRQQGETTILDIIAPADLVVNQNYLQLDKYYVRTMFVYTYPRYLYTNWLSPIITYDIVMDIGMYIYPVRSKAAMSNLRTKVSQLESTHRIQQEKGLVSDPELETAIGDVERLRQTLQTGELKLFRYSLYFTIYAETLEELETISKQMENLLGGKAIYTKEALLQMEQGFTSTLPVFLDELSVTRNLDTGSVSSVFPFTSSELTANKGILYGLNRHNNSLVLFDRFTLENPNMVVFAKSGSGKSYAIKLEILRSLMFGVDIIVIDPENEYRDLCDAVGGTYIDLSIKSEQKINPLDLPTPNKNQEPSTSLLREKVILLHGLMRLMLGKMSSEEEAILDKALFETYALKDITHDPATFGNEPPVLGDLHSVLENMRGADKLATKLTKFTEGTFAGLLNNRTNFNLEKGFVVFSVRDLEDELRPIAMYMMLSYIWDKVRSELRKRILTIDEAWWMMQYEDSAKFLYGIAKRSRKYYLGLTIISQDVEDFLTSRYGRSVVANSSLQLLLKQAPSSIDNIAEVFHLTDGEKFLLLNSDVGEGLFFAGLNHVAIKVIASPEENVLITSKPEEILNIQQNK